MPRTRSTVTTRDGIDFYYEQEGEDGPDVVLIPDGWGECQMFDLAVTKIAAAGFRVTTMDMPGMSRSSAPSETYTGVTAQKLAKYIIGLMDALGIDRASLWGCSSGGSTVLALALDYSSRVRNAMAHEVPTAVVDSLTTVFDPIINDNAAIARICKEKLAPGAVGDVTKWNALGDEVHARLERNYAVWVRGYPRTIPGSAPFKQLREATERAPIDWTVGASTPTGAFFDNIVIAGEKGIGFRVLPGRHFPYVTDVDNFVKYVVETTRKYVG